MDTEQENMPSEFDWDEAARTVGASSKQVKFCQAKLKGASNTEAARQAGYAGEDAALRSTAYQVSRGPKVAALMALAAAGGAGVLDDILSDDEAKRILSRMARQGDANAKVRAIQALEQMKAADAEAAARARDHAGDPFETLNSIAEILPDLAVKMAREAGLAWRPTPEQEEKMREQRRVIALQYLSEMKANGHPQDGSAATQRAVVNGADSLAQPALDDAGAREETNTEQKD